METIGVRKLKSHLSEYLHKAQRGEHIVITQRGREIAELRPLSETRQALKASALVTWSGGKPAGLRGIVPRGKPVAETVLEDRR